MNGMGHTPGPWELSIEPSTYVSSGVRATDIRSADDWVVATVLGDGPPMQANAKLIAAAPALLEALEKIIEEAPKEKPPEWVDEWGYRSQGNYGDVGADAMECLHWRLAEIARPAVAQAKGGK